MTVGRNALARLQECYRTRGVSELTAGRNVAGITSNTVPWELLAAAGLQPLLLSSRRKATPLADPYMEDVFPPRFRSLFEDLLAGRFGFLNQLIIPRSSEQEHKLFLYLREMQRLHPEFKLPDVHLYNLLQSGTPEAHAYTLARTRDLAGWLGVDKQDLIENAIRESNCARRALDALLQRRRLGHPGAAMFPLIGAFYFMDRASFAELAIQALQELETEQATNLPRVLIKGAMLDQPDLHELIESHGLIVSAEDDWWGSRAATPAIREDGDLLEAIADAYAGHAQSPRIFPAEIADHWFHASLAEVQGVVFFLPPDDDVYGWDYPRHLRYLNQRNIPSLLIREDVLGAAPSQQLHEQLEAFAASLRSL